MMDDELEFDSFVRTVLEGNVISMLERASSECS
jgi:hypothetical protein